MEREVLILWFAELPFQHATRIANVPTNHIMEPKLRQNNLLAP